MADSGHNTFDPLVKGLSLEQRLEFFRVLHTAGVTRQDVELAQLLRALQLYKAFYDEIPARVRQAVKEADALHQTFKSLHESVATRLDRMLSQLERNTKAASTITNEFREARTVIASAIEKSTTDIAETLQTTLRKSLAAGLLTPFETFVNDIKDRCGQTAREAEQISVQLKQARRIHIGGYALAAAVITLVLTAVVWINTARHYAQREKELVQKTDQNRQILSELARNGSTLKLQNGRKASGKRYLIVEQATSVWMDDQDAVVELK